MQLVLVQLLDDGRVDVALPVPPSSRILTAVILPGEDWCDDAKLERFPAGAAAARPLLLVVQPSKESVTKYWPIWQRIPTRRGRLRRETKH